MSEALSLSSQSQVDLLKRTICKGATDDELALFVGTANRIGLDPFARQIFAVKRWDGREKREVMSIQVSIDGLRLVAERTGCYAPGRLTEFSPVDGVPHRAVAFVKKHSHGEWHEVPEEATYDEFVQRTKDGAVNSMWARMPRVMLAKCAEARALRRAFPVELSGLYIPEEMGERDPAVTVGGYAVANAPESPPPADAVEEIKTLEALEACKTKAEAIDLLPRLAALTDPIKSQARDVYQRLP